MELKTYKDFLEWAPLGTDTNKKVWFVGFPKISRGYHITDEYELDCPIQEGYLHEVGYNRGEHPYEEAIKFTSHPYCYDEKDDFTFTFYVYEGDIIIMNKRGKIFTEEKEAERYWKRIRKPALAELEEKNKKYSIKLSDICTVFNIPEEEKYNIVIKQHY